MIRRLRNRRTLRLMRETSWRVADAITLAEGALDGSEGRRSVLSGDGKRAQRALVASVSRGEKTSVPRGMRRGKFRRVR